MVLMTKLGFAVMLSWIFVFWLGYYIKGEIIKNKQKN